MIERMVKCDCGKEATRIAYNISHRVKCLCSECSKRLFDEQLLELVSCGFETRTPLTPDVDCGSID